MALCDSHSGSHWLSLPLSGILWPSVAHYCSLISRIQPLIGSQGPCSALIADATMTYFLPLWCEGYMVVVKVIIIIYRTIVFHHHLLSKEGSGGCQCLPCGSWTNRGGGQVAGQAGNAELSNWKWPQKEGTFAQTRQHVRAP